MEAEARLVALEDTLGLKPAGSGWFGIHLELGGGDASPVGVRAATTLVDVILGFDLASAIAAALFAFGLDCWRDTNRPQGHARHVMGCA